MTTYFPVASVICQECDDIIRTTLQHETVSCKCGASVHVVEEGDAGIIAAFNPKETKQEAPASAPTKAPTKKAQKKGATHIAREYYSKKLKKYRKGKISRKEIIDHVVNELGVNKGTASVQWSKFLKAN